MGNVSRTDMATATKALMVKLCKNSESLLPAHVARLLNVLRQAMSNISAHSHSPMPSTQCQYALKNKPYVVTSKLSSLERSME